MAFQAAIFLPRGNYDTNMGKRFAGISFVNLNSLENGNVIRATSEFQATRAKWHIHIYRQVVYKLRLLYAPGESRESRDRMSAYESDRQKFRQ